MALMGSINFDLSNDERFNSFLFSLDDASALPEAQNNWTNFADLDAILKPAIGPDWFTIPYYIYSDIVAIPYVMTMLSIFPNAKIISRPSTTQQPQIVKANGESLASGFSAMFTGGDFGEVKMPVSGQYNYTYNLPGCVRFPSISSSPGYFEINFYVCDRSAFVDDKLVIENGTEYHVKEIRIFVREGSYKQISVHNVSKYTAYDHYQTLKQIYDAGYSPAGAAPDPYEDGGTSSENEGGDGTFDDSSDTIIDSTVPTVSAANTGFTRIYNPTLSQIQSLANYLWTDSTIIQTLWNHVKQFLENPMDAFIAFNLLPCTIPDGGTVEFKVMYIGTGVNMTAAASQFVDVDCGTLNIEKYYDSALDYSPYTKVSIFLPFIGSVQLDTDDVMGKTISVKYRIDIVSGGCVAKIFVDGSIHYQYSGHCAITIPFTSADFTGYISAMIQTAKAVTSIAAGAAGNTQLASSLAGMPEQRTGKSTTTETVSARNPDTGRMRNVARTVTERESSSGTEASFSSLVANNFNNTVGTVMGSKALVDRSGAFSGNTGYLGVRRPFVVIERPKMCNPAEYGTYNGRPAMLTLKLGNCSGYTQVQQVQLTGISATNPELDEIGSLLKGGVVF